MRVHISCAHKGPRAERPHVRIHDIVYGAFILFWVLFAVLLFFVLLYRVLKMFSCQGELILLFISH